jgi:hypothetical protein
MILGDKFSPSSFELILVASISSFIKLSMTGFI